MNSKRIERILDSGYKAVLVTTGGGSSALNALLNTPGASRFVADAQIPYSPEALDRFLGEAPEQSVSPATARALAIKAFELAADNVESALRADLRSESARYSKAGYVGISCTAALTTDRKRRGADRAFICIKTEQAEKIYSLHLSKTSREEQETFLSEWLLVLIAQAVGAERGLMLPGSFHPVHQGHINLLQAAEELSCLHGVFELSCANVDKPDIPEHEIIRRAAAIKDVPVALTHAPRFVQKAELFPKTTFVLGYDTAARLIDYAKGEEWDLFQTLETSFLVAGRFTASGGINFQPLEKQLRCGTERFQGLETLALPVGFESLFESIPESVFREDISSTKLRNGK